MLGDRYPRERVLLATNLTRIVLVRRPRSQYSRTRPSIVVYVLAIAATIATTPFRSAQAALTPSLARTPSELTAANAVASAVDSIAFFVGPALAGVLLAVASSGVVFALTAALIVLSTVFLLLIRLEGAERPRGEIEALDDRRRKRLAGLQDDRRESPAARTHGRWSPHSRRCWGGPGATSWSRRSSSRLRHTAESDYLNAAIGVGAFFGAVAALSLTGVHRLSPAFLVGLASWGSRSSLLASGRNQPLAISLFASPRVRQLVRRRRRHDTLIQRAVADEVLARVFGVIQMLVLASMGIGAALAPAFIFALGIDGALIATGVFLPALVFLLGAALAPHRRDRRRLRSPTS